MRYRPSPAFVLCLMPMLATGAVGGWIWHKADSVPMHVRAKSSFVEAFRYKEKPRYDEPTPEQRAQTRQAGNELRLKLEAEFPVLKVLERPAPDDQNGFLQLHLLSGPPLYQVPAVSQEFRQMLAGTPEWNPEQARRLLGEESEWVGRIEAIAALKDRSSSNMPEGYIGFFSATTGKMAAETLLIKARLAAEARDEKEALRLVSAVGNLSDHFRKVETPTLLAETVGILIDLNLRSFVFQHVLPALGREADLVKWQEALKPGDYSPAELGRAMRAEWLTCSLHFLYPAILNPKHENAPPDPDVLAHLYAEHYARLVSRLETESMSGLQRDRGIFAGEDLATLSSKSREIYQTFSIGSEAWSKGFVRAAVIMKQHQAALELLISEKAGNALDAAAITTASREPTEGRSFVFDPSSREITTPAGMESVEVQPLELPW